MVYRSRALDFGHGEQGVSGFFGFGGQSTSYGFTLWVPCVPGFWINDLKVKM